MKALLVLSLVLTACGSESDQMTDNQKKAAILVPESAEPVPNLSQWQQYPGAVDQCQQVDNTNVMCQTTFQAGRNNCGDATFKFVAIKDGYMYVQTKNHVFIRQGEPHQLIFDEKADIYKITDETTVQYYHVFRCYDADGRIVDYKF